MSKQKYTAAQMIEALRAAGGVIAVAARAIGCDRNTVYAYMGRYSTVKDAYDEANETNLDVAEAGLMAFVRGQVTENGERRTVDDRVRLDATKYYLRTKGRTRGYGDRMEVTGEDGGAIRIERVNEKPKEATE